MAGRYPIKCDQGSTLTRVFKMSSLRSYITGVTNTANPTITTDIPHVLSAGNEVVISSVEGAGGVNNSPLTPVWTVATTPTSTTFTITTSSAPGVYTRGGKVSVPRDLTGYTARMHVRSDIEDADVVLSATTTDGRLVISAPSGSAVPHQVTLTIDATTMAGITAKSYRYDLEVVSAGGVVLRVVEGPLTVRREVTR